jgi:glutathione synthase/RimK-type ligase-like ATP-grasp enzyme
MVLLCGIPSESPLALVCEALKRFNAQVVIFNQRQFASMSIKFEIVGGEVSGWLEIEGCGYPLEGFQGVYVRLMDDRLLPELADEPQDSPRRQYCRCLHEALARWCEVSPARVVNRTAPMSSNSSKPYQAQLIRRHGFEIPEALITNDPELVLDFRQRHKKIIFKSLSGVRSIVQTFEEKDLDRLNHIRWCPTQFQEFVEGDNVRVHVVGSQVFATHVTSDATDYRYSAQQVGETAQLEAIELPDDVAARCVTLSKALGLAFSGIDLKITPDKRVFCFEVNPCPGFSYYEANTGQPISDAVAHFLAYGEEEMPPSPCTGC